MGNYLRNRGIRLSFISTLTTWQLINNLLRSSKKKGKEYTVAKHLIGASLHLTFTNIIIRNQMCDSDNNQSTIPFDYFVGDTAFHVTVSPMFGIYEKCKRNIENGFRVYLIVPAGKLAAARENAEGIAAGKIAVESIESFVSQNIEELSDFSKDRLGHGFYRLLRTYNERVDAVEIDKSMLIEIPRNLAHYAEQ